jgi:Tol biopolymer transport system component
LIHGHGSSAELREVVKMVGKQTKPDRGAREEPEDRERPNARRRPFAVVAAIVVAVAAGGASCTTDDGAAPPVQQPGDLSPGLYAVNIERGMPHLVVKPPAGSDPSMSANEQFALSGADDRIAFVASVDDYPQIFVMNFDGTDQRQLTVRTSSRGEVRILGAGDPAWSPDGSQIAYVGSSKDGTSDVYVIDSEGGPESFPTRVTRERLNVGSPAWSPDGTVIFYQVDLPGLPIIRSIDVATGRTTKIVGDAGLPDISPDGTQIAFNTWSMARVTLANIDGSERQVISSPGDRGGARWSPDAERLAFHDREDNTYVYDVALAKTRRIEPGLAVDWIDNQALLVSVE